MRYHIYNINIRCYSESKSFCLDFAFLPSVQSLWQKNRQKKTPRRPGALPQPNERQLAGLVGAAHFGLSPWSWKSAWSSSIIITNGIHLTPILPLSDFETKNELKQQKKVLAFFGIPPEKSSPTPTEKKKPFSDIGGLGLTEANLLNASIQELSALRHLVLKFARQDASVDGGRLIGKMKVVGFTKKFEQKRLYILTFYWEGIYKVIGKGHEHETCLKIARLWR